MVEFFTRCTNEQCDWQKELDKGGPVCSLPPGKKCPCDTTKPGNEKVQKYHQDRRDKYKKKR